MKKKGFTLIELLAVIVILAIISVITVPIAVNVIEKSRMKAFEDKVIAASRKIDDYMLENDDFKHNEGEKISVNRLEKIIDYKFESGSYKVVGGKLEAYFISDGKYCANGKIENLKIGKDCKKLDITEAVVDTTKIHYTSTSRKIRVSFDEGAVYDEESDIKKYIISLYKGNELLNEVEQEIADTVEFDRLTNNTTYKIVIDVINKNNISLKNKIEKQITTLNINEPTYTVNYQNGWSQTKTVTINFNDPENKYTHEYSLDQGDEKSWIEVSGNTKEITFTDVGSVIAQTTDKHNYITSASYDVTTVDPSKPTSATVSVVRVTSNSIKVKAIGVDGESNIYGYQFKLNDQNWTSIQTADEYTWNGLTTGDYNIKIKVINNTYPNNEINENNSRESSIKTVSTVPMCTPQYSIDKTGWQQSKVVSISYPEGEECYGDLKYSLDDGTTWRDYNSTDKITFNASGTVIAKSMDGNNEKSASTYDVTQIDTEDPQIGDIYTGRMLFTDPNFASGVNSIKVYNNEANGTVTHTRVAETTPEGSYKLHIKTAGAAKPGLGGFYFGNGSAANKVFISRIVAKIPVGYTLEWASNAVGTGYTNEWLTSNEGTGKWEEYINVTRCGSSGTFSTTSFFYINGTAATASAPVEWDVAYATVIDQNAWGITNSFLSYATDSESGLVAHGVNSSDTSGTFNTTFTSRANAWRVGNVSANGTYYTWYKDAAGRVASKSASTSKIDSSNPTITWSVASSTAGSNNWYKAITFRATLADTGGSGIASAKYCTTTNASCDPTTGTAATISSGKFDVAMSNNTTATRVCGIVYDVAGRASEVKCTSAVKVDGTAPTCGSTFSGTSTTWATSRTISVGCTDSHSKCGDPSTNTAKSTFSTTYTTNYTTHKTSITIKDLAGNSKTCTASSALNIYVGTTATVDFAGTNRNGSNIKQLKATVSATNITGGISYAGHEQNTGDLAAVSNGTLLGNASYRLEAIKIYFTGNLANAFNFCYRVHIGNYGWLNAAANGTLTGSKGKSVGIFIIQYKVVPKSQSCPAFTDNEGSNITTNSVCVGC